MLLWWAALSPQESWTCTNLTFPRLSTQSSTPGFPWLWLGGVGAALLASISSTAHIEIHCLLPTAQVSKIPPWPWACGAGAHRFHRCLLFLARCWFLDFKGGTKKQFLVWYGDIGVSWTSFLPLTHQIYSSTQINMLWEKFLNQASDSYTLCKQENFYIETNGKRWRKNNPTSGTSHRLGGNSHLPASPWVVKGLDPISSTLTSKTSS